MFFNLTYRDSLKHNSRKYGVLCNLLDAITKLRNKYEIDDDYTLMNTWAQETSFNDFEKDIIGRIKYLGIATFQHLRMNYGVNAVKPDRQVKEVLKNEFGFKGSDKKSIIAIGHISRITGYSPLELNQIFVNYGSGYYDAKPQKLKTKTCCQFR